MTNQELFDKVVREILSQGRPSTGRSGLNCQYRGHDGARCAAGVLIRDEYYDPKIEGCTVGTAQAMLPAGACEWARDQLDLVRALQKAHDEAACAVFNSVHLTTEGERSDLFKEQFRHNIALISATLGLDEHALGS